jgi:hypothetical protein
MTTIEESQEQQQEEQPAVLYHDYYLSDIEILKHRMPVVLKIVDGCTRCRKLLIQQETGDCE